MFVNFTNHPSEKWSEQQHDAALAIGEEICDLPFPAVGPYATHEEIQALANTYADKIQRMNPDAVLCQGEFTLTFAVVTLLKANGISVLAASSERVVTETVEDGVTKKNIEFHFASFRRY